MIYLDIIFNVDLASSSGIALITRISFLVPDLMWWEALVSLATGYFFQCFAEVPDQTALLVGFIER